MKTYLVCFDISNDSHRHRVGNILLGYGDRVQKSVFEISIQKPTELQALCKKLKPLLNEDDDLRFYYLTKESIQQSQTLAGEPVALFPSVIVV